MKKKTPLLLPADEFERGFLKACAFGGKLTALTWVVLRQLKKADIPTLAYYVNAKQSSVKSALRVIHKAKEIHVAEYVREGTVVKGVWAFGKGKDAILDTSNARDEHVARANDNAEARKAAAAQRFAELLSESVDAIGDIRETKHGAEVTKGNVRIHKMR